LRTNNKLILRAAIGVLILISVVLAIALAWTIAAPVEYGRCAYFANLIVSLLAVPFQVLLVFLGVSDTHDVGVLPMLLGVGTVEALILFLIYTLIVRSKRVNNMKSEKLREEKSRRKEEQKRKD
jgi:hypothetical protein